MSKRSAEESSSSAKRLTTDRKDSPPRFRHWILVCLCVALECDTPILEALDHGMPLTITIKAIQTIQRQQQPHWPLRVSADATMAEITAKWAELYGIGWYYQHLSRPLPPKPNDPTLYMTAVRYTDTLRQHGIGDGDCLWQVPRWGGPPRGNQINCHVCGQWLNPERMTVLQPCGHAGVCRDCAAPLKTCPYCRVALQ